MNEPLKKRVAAVAALDEPTRRRVYEHVAAQQESVSRDDAAASLELPRTTAAFHLDRLVDEGLLEVIFARRSGRRGPGAGRPAKLYRRSRRQVTVSLPDRRYDLPGWLLAAAVHEAERSGESPRAVLDRRSYERGVEIGEAARAGVSNGEGDAAMEVLSAYGFEPRMDEGAVVLGNCPFHALAQDYPETVCGMNARLLDGVLDGLGVTHWQALLRPAPDACCVRLNPAATPGDAVSPDAG